MSIDRSERDAILSRARQGQTQFPPAAPPAPAPAAAQPAGPPPPYTSPVQAPPYALSQPPQPQQPQMSPYGAMPQPQPAPSVTVQPSAPGRPALPPGTVRATGPKGASAQFVDPNNAPSSNVVHARGAQVVQDVNRGASVRMQGAARPTGVRGATLQQHGGVAVGPQQHGQPPQQGPAMPTPWMGGAAIPMAAPSQTNAAIADLTVIMSQHARPQHLESQLRALKAQSVLPAATAVWVNPAGVPLDDRLLAGLAVVRANKDMGPWMRWRLAEEVQTRYTLVIDDDCVPGPEWIRSALDRLHQAEIAGDRIVVCAGGFIYTADQFDQVFPAGPEAPRLEEQAVDIGRGAWLFPSQYIADFSSFPRLVPGVLSQALHFSAALQHEGITQMVLPYPPGRQAVWGMLEPPRRDGTSGLIDARHNQGLDNPSAYYREQAYIAYRQGGWEPWCVMGPRLERERQQRDNLAREMELAAKRKRLEKSESAKDPEKSEATPEAETVRIEGTL